MYFRGATRGRGFGALTQRLQYPLIKEYSLSHTKDPTIISGIFLYRTLIDPFKDPFKEP